jgi:uncharacterized protein (TIGR02147 family)
MNSSEKERLKTSTSTPREFLRQELSRRTVKNPRYSLRSFARTLGVSHTFLSMLLSGKRPFTEKVLSRFSEKLGLSPQEKKTLLKGAGATTEDQNHYHISLDVFAIIAEWYHYGILNLLKLPDFTSNLKWISKRLNISELEAKLAIERLLRLEFITEDKKGNWHRTIPDIKVDNQMFSAACKKFQSQVLEKAKYSLENDPFEERAIESFTLVMDSSQIPYARKRIREVSKELSKEFQAKGKKPNQVYNLGIQIYPITKGE